MTVGVYAIADRGPIDVSVFVGIAVATALAALLGDAARNRRELGEVQEPRPAGVVRSR